MKYAILALALVLTGCGHNPPVPHAFPEPPARLLERCPQLKQLAQDETRLSELLKVVTENYSTYYQCATKDDALIEWVQVQKQIHDSVFNKK